MYPRLLNLDEETKTRLISYLNYEIDNHNSERTALTDDLIRWQNDYIAKPRNEVKTFPFKGAANIVIPLTAIVVESVQARIMTRLFGLDQFVSAKLVDEFANLDRSLESYLDWELLYGARFKEKLASPVLECLKFGNGIAKVTYSRTVKSMTKDIGGRDSTYDIVTSQGCELMGVPLANFLMPFNAQCPQTADWCGEIHRGNKYKFELLEESGLFQAGVTEKLNGYFLAQSQGSGPSDAYRQNIEQKTNTVPSWPNELEWYEIWLAWDVDGGKKKKEIVVHYHRLSQTILAVRYNWYSDLRRPYRIADYIPLEYRWRSIGIGQMNEQFQKEVTIQHRQRLDAGTLANANMLKVKKLSGYGPGEPVFPGKMWFVDDMSDIETFQLGGTYPQAANNEQQTLYYSQSRSGVNELNMGMPQVGTPGTATSDLTRVQEGNLRFDSMYMNLKQFVDDLILDAVCCIAQYGPRDARYFQFTPDGPALEAFFRLPIDLLRSGVVAKFEAAGAKQNKLLDRNNWTQLAGIMVQYYTQMIQLAQQTQPEIVPVISKQAMLAASEAYKQVLESFDVRNINRLTLDLNGIFAQLSQPAGPGQPPSPSAPAGMELPPNVSGAPPQLGP